MKISSQGASEYFICYLTGFIFSFHSLDEDNDRKWKIMAFEKIINIYFFFVLEKFFES